MNPAAEEGPAGEWAPLLILAWRLAERVGARSGLDPVDREDFRSWALVRVMERDHAILRKFRGESAPESYLTVVLANLLRDFRNYRFGKWRPSTEARRLGPLAVALEVLVQRDGVPLVRAVEQLATDGFPTLQPLEAALILDRLPTRYRRSFESGASLESLEHPESADRTLWATERNRALERARRALAQSMATLSEDDRILIELRYMAGRSVADIARNLGVPQKPLYRRISRCLDHLRRAPELRSLEREDLRV